MIMLVVASVDGGVMSFNRDISSFNGAARLLALPLLEHIDHEI